MADELTKQLSEYCTEPHWPNGCEHGGYLFSFTSLGLNPERLDVYCWDNNGLNEQEFCLRHGPEGQNRSPGDVMMLIRLSDTDPYNTCLQLLKLHGRIVFQPNEKQP